MQPQVMKHKDVISSNSNDNNDDKNVQRAKVVDPKNTFIYDQRYWYAHYNLQYTASPQEQTPLMETQIQPHKHRNKLTYPDIFSNSNFLFLLKK